MDNFSEAVIKAQGDFAVKEIERLRAELEKANKYADHLGMSLRDVKRERDEALQTRMVCGMCHTKIEAALAKLGADKTGEVEQDLHRCPSCGGPADNGFSREIPPSPYYCTKCMEKLK